MARLVDSGSAVIVSEDRREQRDGALFEQTAVGVALVAANDGRLIDVNRRFSEMFGSSVDELVGSDLADRVEPEHRPVLRAVLAAPAGELRDRVAELGCRRRDGEPVWVRLTIAPMSEPHTAEHRVVIVEDITDRWLAEVRLARHIAERERAMSASRESEARERLALEASRAKTDFLTHMSHELRTPLNAVLGLSEALLERIFGELNAAQANALATIHASGRHLLDLINDVLDIARVESGVLPIECEQVVLRRLIDESTALMANQLASKGQRLLIDLAPALPPVDVDGRRIKQVLLNLLGNASKFSPTGATVTLRAAGRDDARQVEVAVSDDGPGIAAADRARIFEPFITLDPSMSRAHGGAGLGLALAKRIVDLHGGQIRVDGELGRGTTFTIALPVSSAYVGEAPAPSSAPSRCVAPPAVADGRAILLAEDDEATVLTVRSYLEGHGRCVRVVRDGVAALEAAAAHDIAAVVMDVQLPGIDGLEVTRRLRARGMRTPVIALTAHAMRVDEQRCLEAGASAYLAKPVRLRQLTEMLARLAEDRR